jgi:acyl carrier protein phosphodiesterase
MLAYAHRPATKDVDAIFHGSASTIRKYAAEIAHDYGWPEDWLNDGVKGFLSHRDNEPGIKKLFRSYPGNHERFGNVGLRVMQDAYLAATAEHSALEYDLDVPEWTEHQGNELHRPHFGSKFENLKATLIAESPLSFRRRLLFVSANALDRASMHADRSPIR